MVAIAFALGAACLQQQVSLPGTAALYCLTSVAMMAVLTIIGSARVALLSGLARRWPQLVLYAVAAALLGFVWSAWRAHEVLATWLPAPLQQTDIRLTGRISGLPVLRDGQWRFTLVPEVLHEPVAAVRAAPFFARKLQLSWTARSHQPRLLAGQRWRLTVRLKRPHAHLNIGLADGERLALQRGIRAMGYVRPGPVTSLPAAGFSVSDLIARLRARQADRIAQVLAGRDHAGVVTALAIGEQSAIAAPDWQRFTRTGTNHLVAISGLHIGLVAGFAAFAGGRLWRLTARWPKWPGPLFWPVPKMAALSAIAAAASYAAMAGFALPTQRALAMLCALLLAITSGRAPRAATVLAMALCLVVLIDPWAVLSVGCYLSFGAVGTILFVLATRGQMVRQRGLTEDDASGAGPAASRGNQMPGRRPPECAPTECRSAGRRIAGRRIAVPRPLSMLWRRLREGMAPVWERLVSAGRIQLAVTLALIPLSLCAFGQTSMVAPLANALAIPWVSFLAVPAVLAGMVLPAPLDASLFAFAHWTLQCLSGYLDGLSALPGAVWVFSSPAVWTTLVATCGLIWWWMPAGWPLRCFGPVLCLPMLLHRPALLAPGEFRVTMLDIGQGNSVVLETRHHVMVYDTGPPVGNSDAGERIVVPWLRAQHLRQIDSLIVSHDHDDHYGGARSVINAMPPAEFRASLPATQPLWRQAMASGARTLRCQRGQHWEWDGVRFDVLWPDGPDPQALPNARSCVVRVANDRYSVLLAGDIEAPQEAALLRLEHASRLQFRSAALPSTPPVLLRADILLVPHHGSRTSSTAPWLKAVSARHAVFQAGYLNRHRHPHPHVVARYLAQGPAGVTVYRSDWDGAVAFETDKTQLRVRCARQTLRRYWTDRPAGTPAGNRCGLAAAPDAPAANPLRAIKQIDAG